MLAELRERSTNFPRPCAQPGLIQRDVQLRFVSPLLQAFPDSAVSDLQHNSPRRSGRPPPCRAASIRLDTERPCCAPAQGSRARTASVIVPVATKARDATCHQVRVIWSLLRIPNYTLETALTSRTPFMANFRVADHSETIRGGSLRCFRVQQERAGLIS